MILKKAQRRLDLKICGEISRLLMDSSQEVQTEVYNSSQKIEFAEFISPKALQKRSSEKSRFVLAWLSQKEKLAGVLEYHLDGLLNLLFVHPQWRTLGIGKKLVEAYLIDLNETPYLFASPKSLVFYLKMGFRFSAPPITKDKFCAYPMIFTNFKE